MLFLLACAAEDTGTNKSDADALSTTDDDGDGYSEADGDCDDTNAARSPGATEHCDDADEDCDGEVDEDAADAGTWYADQDLDGYGAGPGTASCDLPDGHVADATDCDDTDSAVHPGATETCDGIDTDCTGDEAGATDAVTYYSDADADGYGDDDATHLACAAEATWSDQGGDCDDADADAFPGNPEVCDEHDNDCDEVVDEDVTLVWYADVDGDGEGTEALIEDACAQPEGYADNARDCDDADPTVYSTAVETCDGFDQDCDGTPDDGFDADGDTLADCFDAEECDDLDNDGDGTTDEDDALDATTWYLDADADGHGRDGVTDVACDAPASYVASADDCDDLDATAFPGATEIADGADDDCDGTIDEGTSAYDDDGDGYTEDDGDCDDADSARSPGAEDACDDGIDDDCDGADAACDGDGDGFGSDDCDDADEDVFPGADEVANGIDDDCDGTIDDGTAAYDDDGDGYTEDGGDCDDGDDTVSPSATEVCANGVDDDCDGTASGCGPSGVVPLADADAKLTGEAAGDQAGHAVAAAGDLDGDGFGDVLVNAVTGDLGGADSGAAYLVRGPLAGTASLSAATARFIGEASGDYAGCTMANIGDVDGDGGDDLAIGAFLEDGGGGASGATYILHSPHSGDVDLSTAAAKRYGEGGSEYSGFSVSGAGDHDGDGLPDLVMGAPYAAGHYGATYILSGASTGTASASTAYARIVGESYYDESGYSVAGVGDSDGDGNDDILVGAVYDDDGGAEAGAAYLLLGPISGSGTLADADAKYVGEGAGDGAGLRVANAGDTDGDGRPDLLIGAYMNNTGAASAVGAAYVILGGTPADTDLGAADADLRGEVSGDVLAYSVAGAGDTDDDGFADVILGAYNESSAFAYGGAAYLALGPFSGTVAMSSARAKFTAEASEDHAGSWVSGAGDVDGDGFADVLVGALENDEGGAKAGAAYVISGGGI